MPNLARPVQVIRQGRSLGSKEITIDPEHTL